MPTLRVTLDDETAGRSPPVYPGETSAPQGGRVVANVGRVVVADAVVGCEPRAAPGDTAVLVLLLLLSDTAAVAAGTRTRLRARLSAVKFLVRACHALSNTYGCTTVYIRVQPPLHAGTAFVTCGRFLVRACAWLVCSGAEAEVPRHRRSVWLGRFGSGSTESLPPPPSVCALSSSVASLDRRVSEWVSG